MLPLSFRAMNPADDLAWCAVADWLEEDGQPERAELVRLTRLLRLEAVSLDTPGRDARRMELLAAGVEPCVATVTNSIGMTLAWIPQGRFLMGSPVDEEERSSNEGPEHEVTFTRAFYLGMYAVTQGEYEAVMGHNPSHFSATGRGKDEVKDLKTNRFPVENVSHEDALKFCKRLSGSRTERENGRVYRLPTEAEWEYACRGGAGSKTPFYFGKSLSSNQANFDGNYPYGGVARSIPLGRTCNGGSYPPNGYGLYDMHGNVYEWCLDAYEEDYHLVSSAVDPFRGAGSYRVIRGGGWNGLGCLCRSAFRAGRLQSFRYDSIGFRIALVPSS